MACMAGQWRRTWEILSAEEPGPLCAALVGKFEVYSSPRAPQPPAGGGAVALARGLPARSGRSANRRQVHGPGDSVYDIKSD